jgi:probable DNA repair protein
MHLTGERRFSSADYQAARRWEQALDDCGSLGFNGRRISWQDFLAALARIVEETLFAPESSDAPIQIMGPVESAGLCADAIWFLGVDEDSWPATGSAHPLLPLQVQCDAAMPHASPLHDWELTQTITARLLASAPIVHFSHALQKNTMETRPSRIVLKLAGPSTPLPASTVHPIQPRTIRYHDTSRIPLPAHRAHGGASLLSAQSQCPFKAFATTRLGAQDWEPAEPGLTAMQRGQLLHHVLRAVWGGPPHGLSNLDDLHRQSDLAAFVAHHVRRTVAEKLPEGVRDRMARRYLALEEQRLAQLVTEWLEYEATRLSFRVEQVEAPAIVQIAGLTLNLRLDRIDCLNDGSLLVIDYKTGSVSIRDWELPRPQDVQLPLYATFALPEPDKAGGLVFAQVQTGKSRIAGCVTDPSATLFGGLKGNNLLMKHRLTENQLSAWRETIEQLARDYLAGEAAVDPRKYPETCVACGLQTVCRILEQQPSAVLDEEEPEVEDD